MLMSYEGFHFKLEIFEFVLCRLIQKFRQCLNFFGDSLRVSEINSPIQIAPYCVIVEIHIFVLKILGGILGTGIDILIGMILNSAIQIGIPRKAGIDAAGALHHIIMRRCDRPGSAPGL